MCCLGQHLVFVARALVWVESGLPVNTFVPEPGRTAHRPPPLVVAPRGCRAPASRLGPLGLLE